MFLPLVKYFILVCCETVPKFDFFKIKINLFDYCIAKTILGISYKVWLYLRMKSCNFSQIQFQLYFLFVELEERSF